MAQIFSNNASALLAIDIDSSATQLQVYPSQGQHFPNPGMNDYFLITLENKDGSVREICKCTHRDNDLFQIERYQEGSIATSWSASEYTLVDHRETAGTFRKFQLIINDQITVTNIGTDTIITASENFSIGTTQLYINGLRKSLGVDYIESSANAIQLSTPMTQDQINSSSFVLDFLRE